MDEQHGPLPRRPCAHDVDQVEGHPVARLQGHEAVLEVVTGSSRPKAARPRPGSGLCGASAVSARHRRRGFGGSRPVDLEEVADEEACEAGQRTPAAAGRASSGPERSELAGEVERQDPHDARGDARRLRILPSVDVPGQQAGVERGGVRPEIQAAMVAHHLEPVERERVPGSVAEVQ
ncbi:MAG: hypothetical protein WKF33_05845 [Thermoleophilaceae bacterium]